MTSQAMVWTSARKRRLTLAAEDGREEGSLVKGTKRGESRPSMQPMACKRAQSRHTNLMPRLRKARRPSSRTVSAGSSTSSPSHGRSRPSRWFICPESHSSTRTRNATYEGGTFMLFQVQSNWDRALALFLFVAPWRTVQATKKRWARLPHCWQLAASANRPCTAQLPNCLFTGNGVQEENIDVIVAALPPVKLASANNT